MKSWHTWYEASTAKFQGETSVGCRAGEGKDLDTKIFLKSDGNNKTKLQILFFFIVKLNFK